MESALRPSARHTSRFHGEGTDFAILFLKNALLSVLTLGIYSFWAKAETRRFLWQSTELVGHRFVYHGTGKELLIGWAKVAGIYFGTALLVFLAASVDETFGLVVQATFGLIIAGLVPYAIYAARRYLLSRTSWRGIRFGVDPRGTSTYVKTTFGLGILSVLTFGLLIPHMLNELYAIRTNNTYLGNLRWRYTGQARDLFWSYVGGVLLAPFTLGISLVFLQAKVSRYRAQHTWIGDTKLGDARFEYDVTGGALLGLIVTNFLLLALTAGLALPWIVVRNMDFVMRRFAVVGDIDVSRVHQVASDGAATADGLSDALDVGVGLAF